MSESIKGTLAQQVNYSGFEPKFSYTLKGINSREFYEGNAAEVALHYCERHNTLLSIDEGKLYADEIFIADLSAVYARDLVSALAVFFYIHIMSLSNEFVVKEFEA